jgi:NADH-quinone oxidoreductase subunit H
MRGESSLRGRLARAMAAVASDVLPPAGAPAIGRRADSTPALSPFVSIVDALACGLLAALPFGQYLVAAQLDVGILFVAAVAAASSGAFVASGSLLRGVRSALEVVWQHVPAAAAVASVVVTTGSLRVQEVERAQGGWPWDWLAFRSPATLVALALLLLCARIEIDGGARADAGSLAALVEDHRPTPPRGPWLGAACRAHTLLVAGLASVLFLGGWLLPGLSPPEQDARPALELAGAAWLLAKTWGIAFALAWVDWALPRRGLSERTRATALWLPLALGVFLAAAAWTWWSPARAAQLLVSSSLVAAVALAAVAVALRVRHGLLAGSGEGRLSPFL